jgi:transposase
VTIKSLLKQLIGVNNIKVKSWELITNSKDIKELFIKVEPYKRDQNRCPICGRRLPGYDKKKTSRQWRSLNVGTIPVYVSANTNRVSCSEHGVITAGVPWARQNSRFTKDFENQVAWLAFNLSKKTLSEFMGIAWNTVGDIINRVLIDVAPKYEDRFDNLVNIGVDETSYRKGHNYITTVVNNDDSTVIWAAEGHSIATLSKFFELLTPEQRASINTVSGDGARWIQACMDKYIPQAERCIDPFHAISWAQVALDDVRKAASERARILFEANEGAIKKRGRGRPKKGDDVKTSEAKIIKNSKFALRKNPENLTKNQREKLEMIKLGDNQLYRAYMLKEKLRFIFKLDDIEEVKEHLDSWLSWARRCRIPSFVALGRKIKRHYAAIIATRTYKISNAKTESLNNKIKLCIRRAYGFRNIKNLVNSVLLVCSNIKIPIANK